jgi:hypothetical protein
MLNNYKNKSIIWKPNAFIYILFLAIQILFYFREIKKSCFFLNYPCTRDQLNKNSTILTRSLNDDRVHQIEQERTDLQRSLIQTSSHYDQLTSEKHGLTVALDELRRMNN